MYKSKKLALVFGMIIFAVLLGSLAGCDASLEQEPTYRVEVCTLGGLPVEHVAVQVFGENPETPVATASTNQDGIASFRLEEGGYTIRLQNLPAGHHAEGEYRLTESTLKISLETRLLTGSDRNQITTLGAGDVMFDLDVTLPTGEKLNLAQVLSEKKLVVLNFWFANCGYCTLEFPAIKQAYLEYAQDVEVLALSPYDSPEVIKQYQGRHSLPFPMASCHASWPMAFGISGYPTTILIDRYGMICAVHTGAVPDAAVWANAFAYFTADDYTQRLFDSLQDVGL